MDAAYLTVAAAGRCQLNRATWHAATRTASGALVTSCSGLFVDVLSRVLDPSTLPTERRCRANGCRQAWGSVAAGDGGGA